MHWLVCRSSVNVFNNVILARNRQLPDDDRMIETCRGIFKSFNVNCLSVCIGWCADQVTLRSERCNDKENVRCSAVINIKYNSVTLSLKFFLQSTQIWTVTFSSQWHQFSWIPNNCLFPCLFDSTKFICFSIKFNK